MPFTPKDWHDWPQTDTPISSVGLEDLETRVATYVDQSFQAGQGVNFGLIKATPGIRFSDGTVQTTAPGSGVPPGWHNVITYGAVGDGIADDTTAVQNAINATMANGGTVYFPPGTYKITSTLHADQNAYPFTLLGSGGSGGNRYHDKASRLLYTGSTGGATGGLITFNSSFNFTVEHLVFVYNNASFTGHLINIDGGPHGADTQGFTIQNCGFDINYGSSNTAESMIRLNKVVIGSIENCNLASANHIIRISDDAGSYVNAFQIEKCTFNFGRTSFIRLGSADCEGLTVRDCTFEAGTNTPAITSNGSQLYNFVLENCWMGDAGANIDWVQIGTCFYKCTLRDNTIFGYGTGTAFTFSPTTSGTFLCLGNLVIGGYAFAPNSYVSLIDIGEFTPGTTEFLKPGTSASEVVSIGSGQGPTLNVDQHRRYCSFGAPGSGTFGIGSRASVPGTYLQGGILPGAVVSLGFKPYLRVAAPADNVAGNGEVQLASGAAGSEIPQLRVSDGNKLAFHNENPITRQTITGSRGGNAALADLLSKLHNVGIITDSTSA